MKRYEAVLLSVIGVAAVGCAGTLDNPEQFEGLGSAVGNNDDDLDAGLGGTRDDGGFGGNGNGGGDVGGGNGGGDVGGGNGGGNVGSGNGGGNVGGGNGSDNADGGVVGIPGASCDFEELMQAKCATAGCHGATAPAAGLDLVTPGIIERYAGKAGAGACGIYEMIDLADPSQSLLYIKVTDQTCGSRMPYAGPLSQEEQDCILTWIESNI